MRPSAGVSSHSFIVDHPEVTESADDAVTVLVVHPYADFVVEKIQYYNATGLAEDADNFIQFALVQDEEELVAWSTSEDEDGTITADTFMTLTPASQVALRRGERITLEFTPTVDPGDPEGDPPVAAGTVTLPAGRLIIHGYYK